MDNKSEAGELRCLKNRAKKGMIIKKGARKRFLQCFYI
jgi:hypothetical protein